MARYPTKLPPGIRLLKGNPPTYQVRVSLGRDPVTGKYPEWTKVVTGSLADAKSARAEMLTKRTDTARRRGTTATVDQVFDDWLLDLERLERTAGTIYGYKLLVNRYIRPQIGAMQVRSVTRSTLLDQVFAPMARNGASPWSQAGVRRVLSAALNYACIERGYISANPAARLRLPSLPESVPLVPTPEQCRMLINVAESSGRAEMGRVYFLAATTGARRGEICGWRAGDVDKISRVYTVLHSISVVPGAPGRHLKTTKNRRQRPVAIDDLSRGIMDAQIEWQAKRAAEGGTALVANPFLFSDALDAGVPWRPDMITHVFERHRRLAGLDKRDAQGKRIAFKGLRKFMTTYGQSAGFSLAEVALRAGHDPAVASKHYTGRVSEKDRQLADAVARLLEG